jgi:probable HAF family extracellular repeat protein
MIRKIITCLFVGLTTAAAAHAASFQGLDFLPFAVSADGSVVVGQGYNNPLGPEAVRWTAAGGAVGLGDLTGGSFYSAALGVSADGSVVVGGGTSANSDPSQEAFRWTQASGMVGLGTLPGGTVVSAATGVSADGSVVAGGADSATGFQGFRWTQADGMTGIGNSYGASAISADGSVIVGSKVTAAGTEAFRWTQGSGPVGLGFLSPHVFECCTSYANAVSADGSVVVGSGINDDGVEAFRWTAATGMVGIGAEDALSVSGDGSIIVGDVLGGDYRADIWDAARGWRDLRSVLVNDYGLGNSLTGWVLTKAVGISADGKTIIGTGYDPNGSDAAWVAHVPEPSTNALAVLAAVCCAFFQRKRNF